MQHKSSLREFLDKSWPEVSSRIGSDTIFEDVAPLMRDLLPSTDDKERLVEAIQILFMTLAAETGAFCAGKYSIEEADQHFRSQAIIYKPNNEKILMYISTESLERYIERVKNKLPLLAEGSKTEGWKFGIVTNMTKWVIFGIEAEKSSKILCEVHELESFMSLESLRPFLRDILTILYFDMPEVVFGED